MNVSKNKMQVVLATGKHRRSNTHLQPEQYTLVQGSTLRASPNVGRTAASAPDAAAGALAAPKRAAYESDEDSDEVDDEELEEAATRALEVLWDEAASGC